MSACDHCLRASVLRSEALTFAETRYSAGLEARRLLKMDPERMAGVLASEHPEVLGGLEQTVATLAAGVARSDGLWTVCRHEPDYPATLANFREPSDIPPVIFGMGDKGLFDELGTGAGVAIVGARRASAYGREVAYSLANEAASIGLIVVSGMALGIDGAAHRGALQAGGRTVAVLAGGPETAYPRSHRLLHEQIRAAGCVIAENPPGSEARRWAFVARNRLIAGTASMTVFVEGGEESGAMHTVGFAEELGLPVGAVPGPVTSPMSAGPNALLAEMGAHLVRDASDLLEPIGFDAPARELDGFADAESEPLDREIAGLIGAGERTPRRLAESLPERSPREISQALGRLELSGRVAREPSGEYSLRR